MNSDQPPETNWQGVLKTDNVDEGDTSQQNMIKVKGKSA